MLRLAMIGDRYPFL